MGLLSKAFRCCLYTSPTGTHEGLHQDPSFAESDVLEGAAPHSDHHPKPSLASLNTTSSSYFNGDTKSSLRASIMHHDFTMTTALDQIVEGIQANEACVPDIQKVKMLGSGGFGVVWLATIDGGKTMIALKELKQPLRYFPYSMSAHDVFKDLPFVEAAIQAVLVHTNIVRTLWADVSIVDPDTFEPLGIKFKDVIGNSSGGSDSDSDTSSEGASNEWTQISKLLNKAPESDLPEVVGLSVRIAMEYCEFGSLFDYLAPPADVLSKKRTSREPLNVAIGGGIEQTQCAELTALDIARGLKLLHINNIIHGDLKPHNILLARDPNNPRGFVAKVSDFGLSQHLPGGQTEIGNVTHGSPPYMAPESICDRRVTKACDVYALGVLMWELWHNILWWGVYDIENKRRQAKRGKLGKLALAEMTDFVPECHRTCPPEYAKLVHQCLDADPSKRPTMKLIVRKLEENLHDMGSFMDC